MTPDKKGRPEDEEEEAQEGALARSAPRGPPPRNRTPRPDEGDGRRCEAQRGGEMIAVVSKGARNCTPSWTKRLRSDCGLRRERELGTNQGAAVLLFILTPYTLLHERMRSVAAVDVTGRSDRYGITNQALIRGTCPRDLPPIQNANVKHSQVIINRLSRFGPVSLFTFRPEVGKK